MNEYTVYLTKEESNNSEDPDWFDEIRADYYDIKTIGNHEWVVFFRFSEHGEPATVFMIRSDFVCCINTDKLEEENEDGE